MKVQVRRIFGWLLWLLYYSFFSAAPLTAGIPSPTVGNDLKKEAALSTLGPGVIEGSQTICAGTIPAPFTSTFPAANGTPPYQYQWQSSTTGLFAGYTDIPAATGLTYSAGVLHQTTYFRRAVRTMVDSVVYTDPVTVTVNPLSVGGTVSGGGNFCPSPVVATLTLAGHTGAVIRWESSTVGDFSSNVTSITHTNTTYFTPPLLNTGTIYYRAVVKSGVCSLAYAAPDTVTVNAASVAGSLSGGTTYCSSTNSTLLSLSGYTGGIVRWESAAAANFSGTVTTIAHTSDTLTIFNLAVTTYYRAVVANGNCAAATTSAASIVIQSAPAGGTLSGDTTVCAGSNNVSLQLSGHSGSIVQWESAASADFSGTVTVISHTQATLAISNLNQTTSYRVRVSQNGCTSYATVATVTVNPNPDGGTVNGSDSVCAGTHATLLTLSGHSGTISRWQSALTSDFSGVITPISHTGTSYNALNVSVTTYFRAELVSGNCTSYAAPASVTVLAASAGGTVTGTNPFSPNLVVCSGVNSTPLLLSGHTGSIVRWESALAADFSGTVTTINHAGASYTALNLTATTYFRVIVQNGLCDTARSTVKVITVVQPTVGGILSGGTAVCTGTNSTQLTLSGHTGAMLRWESALTADFSGTVTNISNTTTQHTPTNLTATTYFRVVLRNTPCDTAFSATDSILVTAATIGGIAGGSDTVCSGVNSTQLTLTGHTGSILRWESATNPGFTGIVTQIANTTATHTATNLSITTYFRAVVKNGSCAAANGAAAAVAVTPNSSGGFLTGGPVTVCIDSNQTTLTATSYVGTIIRWESSSSAGFTGPVTSIAHTGASYTASNLAALTYYRVVIQNGVCPPVYSPVTYINVQPQPNGGTVVGGSTVCTGTNTTQLTLVGHQGNIVRWESALAADFSGTVTPISHTTTQYTAQNLSQTTYYRAVVRYLNCATVSSAAAAVVVTPLTAGGVLGGGPVAVCSGNNSTILVLNGSIGNIVKWQASSTADFSAGITDIVSGNDSLTVTNLTTTTYYRVIVQNGVCPADTSTIDSIVVVPSAVAGVLSGGGQVCTGNNSTILVVAGTTGNIVKWQASTTANFSTGVTDIASTNDSLTVTNLSTTTYYRVMVQNGICPADTSNSISIIVNQPAAAGLLAGGTTVCSGIHVTTLILSGTTGSIVKWQASTSVDFSTDVTDIASTNDSLTVNNLSNTTHYRVIVQNGVCPADTSQTDSIVVQQTAVAGILTGGTTVCSGIHVTTLILTGTTGSIVKWQASTSADFSTGVTDIASTNDSLTISNLSTTTYYRVIVQNGICPADTSNSISIIVNQPAVAGLLAGGTTVCSGNNVTTLTLTGTTGNILQWQASSSADFSTGVTDIASTNDSLTVSNLSTTTYYRVIVQNGICPPDTSQTDSIVVQQTAVAGILTGGTTVCSGINVTTLILSGTTGNILKWQASASADFSTGVTDIASTNDSLTVTNLSTTTYYRVIVQNGICPADTSQIDSIVVHQTAVAGILTGGTTVCSGIHVTTLILSGTTGNIVKWQTSTTANFSTGVTDIASTNDSLTVTNLSTTTYYRVMVQNGICPPDTSQIDSIVVHSPAIAGILTGGTTVCSSINVTTLILSGTTGNIVKWQTSTTANFSTGVTDIASTNDSLTVNNLSTTTYYRVIVQNGVCPADTSNSISIIVNQPAVAGLLGGGTTVCSGIHVTTLILTGTTGNIVKWQASASADFSTGVTDIASTNDSLTVTNLSTTTYYRVIVQNGVCPADTSQVDSIVVVGLPGLNAITAPVPDSFFVSGDPGTITGTLLSGAEHLYQWFVSTTDSSNGFSLIPGATGRDYDPGILLQTSWFRRSVLAAPCPVSQSNSVRITIMPLPPSDHPLLGIALLVEEPTALTEDTYVVTYVATLRNYGDGMLHRIRLLQPLQTLIPAPSVFVVQQITADNGLAVNPGFDGVLQQELLDSTGSSLAPGESRKIRLELHITPNLPAVTYINQQTALSTEPISGGVVRDLSTEGFDPDPDGDGKPDEALPTPVSLHMFIPNGFSPDGDGVNDAFVIPGIEKYPNNRIEIFNRWGNKVYEAAPYDNSWTGTSLKSGTIIVGDGLLPNGTYFYVLDFGVADVMPLNGFVVIKK